MGRTSFSDKLRMRLRSVLMTGVSTTRLSGGARVTVGTGTIHHVQEVTPNNNNDPAQRTAAPIDESRLVMMRREKRMTVEERVNLFERLSRDAAWIRSAATRVR